MTDSSAYARIPFNEAVPVGNELKYLAEAIQQGHISGNGPFTQRAERLLAQISHSPDVLMTSSCTHALELAARLLDLGPGDEVIVPAYTFVSTAAAFALTGARPIFVDVSPRTLNLDVEAVAAAITARTRAICTVHYAGIAQGVDELASICSRMNIPLVEDNAHGLGGYFNDQALGTFGTLSTMSFHETKNVTCGEGGALGLNATNYVERAEVLREKGTNRNQFLRGQVDKYTWVEIGSSWVPSDMLAAFLVGQLEVFDNIQERRLSIWRSYSDQLSAWSDFNGIRMPYVPEGARHPAHMFYLQFPHLETRSRFIDHMNENGILAVFHYQALNESPIGQSLGGHVGQCPVAERASRTLVRLPLFSSMTSEQVERVIAGALSFKG